MGEVSQDLNHCPFCNAQFPKGPAYYCPKCGKKLDEAFSKRNFFDEVSDSLYYSEKAFIDDNSLENSFDDEINDYDSQDELKNSIMDLKTALDNKRKSMDKNNEENISIDILKDKETECDDLNPEQTDSSLNTESKAFNEVNDINKKLKLNLFLMNCVDDEFFEKVLDSIGSEYEGLESATNEIVSSMEFDKVLSFRENPNAVTFSKNNSIDLLKSAFDEMPVIKIIILAKNYGIPVASGKEALINNFSDKFSFSELIGILEKNNLPITNDLSDEFISSKTILEQIYDSNLENLETYAKLIDYDGNNSRISLIEAIVNHFDNEFLLNCSMLTEDSFKEAK